MNNLLESWFKMNVGEGAFYAAFGLVFVFAGITLLVAILLLVGFVMKKIDVGRQKRQERKAVPAPAAEPETEEGIPPEVVAAITAAIAAYTGERAKCEFVVRRIKRM